MDDATVRKRCEEILQRQYPHYPGITATDKEVEFYRAAYADGLEAAAKEIENGVSRYDGEEARLTVSVFANNAATRIRQQAKKEVET